MAGAAQRERRVGRHRAIAQLGVGQLFKAAFTEAVQTRVDVADAATLDTWEERILTATCLDDVLG